jgi:hypothetical protein
MARKRKAAKKRRSRAGVTAKGRLMKGFRYVKGGRVVKAKKKR